MANRRPAPRPDSAPVWGTDLVCPATAREKTAQEAHAQVDLRDGTPHEQVAEALFDVAADVLFAAIASPDFAARLSESGLAVVPVCGQVPQPPADWLHGGVNLIGATYNPLDTLTALWRRAYEAGWEGHAAANGGGGQVPR